MLELESRSQRRSLAEIDGVNLCSNDYLGLATHPTIREAVIAAISGGSKTGGTGSRLLSGHAAIWDELENEFANFAGTEATLYFGSGYMANLGLLTSLAGKDDLVFSDALNHASLIDGIRLSGARKIIYAHLDFSALESLLKQFDNHSGRKLVVTESVFSMNGDIAPVGEIVALAEKYGAGLIVDEAHATAVHGPAGRGFAAQAGVAKSATAVVHTCGKALASVGALVCGSRALREHLVNHARTFIFSTAMPPYMAAQVLAALRIAVSMDQERAELATRAKKLAATLRADGWDTANSSTQIVPAVIGGNEDCLAAAAFLQQRGFAVRAIRPPTVAEGTSRLRFSLTTAISEQELERLAGSLNVWRAQQVRAQQNIPVHAERA